MAIPVILRGRATSTGTTAEVAVLPSGALAVGQADDDLSKSATMSVDDTPVEVIGPQAGREILVTGALISTNRDVGVNGATVDVYYVEDVTSTDTTNLLIQVVDFAKNSAVATTPISLRVPIGNYVVAKTNDNSATASLFYHYEAA